MTDEKQFVDGLIVKEGKQEFIKLSLSIKKQDFTKWYKNQLSNKDEDWINIDVKKSKSGKLYAELNSWKPKKQEDNQELKSLKDSVPEDIPF